MSNTSIVTVDLLALATSQTYFDTLAATNSSTPTISLLAYDPGFYQLFGSNVSSKLVVNETWQAFHEGGVYNRDTNALYAASNWVGNLSNPINITEIKLDANYEVTGVVSRRFNGLYEPNGGTNYWPPGSNLSAPATHQLWCDEGDFNHTSSLVSINPATNETQIVIESYLGRKNFSSLNDVRQHQTTGDLWFTDADYGYFQHFRPAPTVPKQVYRFSPDTGVIAVVADGFVECNGLEFSPDYQTLYVTDTGAQLVNVTLTNPATIYAYDVSADNKTVSGRRTFAYCEIGLPDGIHTDTAGNVWAGCGDGVHVWNSDGLLLGKVFLGKTSNNFAFGPNGRLWIFSNYELWQVDGLKYNGREVARDFQQ